MGAVFDPLLGRLRTKDAGIEASDIGIYNVDDYGAVGDGVTDDTSKIQSAISALIAGNGSILRFGKGKTYYSTPLGTQTTAFEVDGNGASALLDVTTSGTSGAALQQTLGSAQRYLHGDCL